MVLAISALLITIAFATFGQRRGVAVDDEVNQIVAQINKIRNEAQKGSGPPSDSPALTAGETLFGQAIEFDARCSSNGGNSCMHIYRLKRGFSTISNQPTNQISPYESSTDIPVTENLLFQLATKSGCNNQFYLGYKQPGSSKFCDPSLFMGASQANPMIVIETGSGRMSFFSTGQAQGFNPSKAANLNNYTADRQGVLRLPIYQKQGGTPASSQYKYNIDINLAGGNEITTTKL